MAPAAVGTCRAVGRGDIAALRRRLQGNSVFLRFGLWVAFIVVILVLFFAAGTLW